MNPIVKQCKKLLKDHYGSQFHGLILYGSIARNISDPESDIDLLVLLKKPFDYFSEIKRITEMLYPLQLKSNRLISIKPAAFDEFENGTIQLYRNAKKEGIAV
ncbi:hypothetical protein A2V82_06400 [candidate division KSB1 bacterium RBG_16_48_16]|nr:MAG: hypothetical protein A2V82_06400 [candidate division KSB1 bacterium RBG_16_48_16]